MGRFVAIGGGDYEELDPIAEKIVKLTNKAVPNVLFIGTALQDSTNPLTSCKKTFKRVAPGCIVKKLSIIRSSYTDEQVDELFSWADVIFVGGGNTSFMLEKWQERGIDRWLKKTFEEDSAVIAGVSAGAICWYSSGYTDSAMFDGEENWEFYTIHPGFDFYEGFFCPHYNLSFRKGFDEAVKTEGIEGIALEDRTAMIYDRGEVSFFSADPSSHAYRFTVSGEKIEMI